MEPAKPSWATKTRAPVIQEACGLCLCPHMGALPFGEPDLLKAGPSALWSSAGVPKQPAGMLGGDRVTKPEHISWTHRGRPWE